MNSKLNEMWKALSAYQHIADTKGYGESWKKMCIEKTEESARAAWAAASADGPFPWSNTRTAHYAADAAAWAIRAADDLNYNSQKSIDYMNKAKGGTK